MNFVVVTSIFAPTQAVRAFARLPEWELVVVGDRKTPTDWALEGATYLSPEEQEALPFETAALLPWNHYGRKMIGYLYAIGRGATVIVDTDDDNAPKDGWACPAFDGAFDVLEGSGFANVYRHFSDAYIWPRGFPLRLLRAGEDGVVSRRQSIRIGVWQFLADGDADVDAIYRLVFDEPVAFSDRSPLVLDRGVVCPFNSQNTFFTRDAFPLLYLPSYVTFRFTDILRGLVAQPVLWESGLHLAFGPATVRQERNPHDYLADFSDEVPMYLQGEAAFEAAVSSVSEDRTVEENLRAVYVELEKKGIVEARERVLLEAWLADVGRITT